MEGWLKIASFPLVDKSHPQPSKNDLRNQGGSVAGSRESTWGALYGKDAVSNPRFYWGSIASATGKYALWIPFRYFFSFLSKIVYLSLGTISSSRGISAYHRSTALVVKPPFRCSAALTVSTTRSTARRRLRCRAFCGRESRHGIFLFKSG